MAQAKTPKSEQTRQRLVQTSLRLFLDQGFDRTTMREIAGAAGLAPGAAYYHFASKEELIFGFYEQSFEEHLPAAEKVLATERDLAARLAGLVNAHLKVSEPYHGLSRVLFRVAADPSHPISPFSAQSKGLRDRNIALVGRVLEGQRVPQDLAADLPELLWLYKMGMLLYWLHDASPGHRRSLALVRQSSVLVAQLIRLSALPGVHGFARKVLRLFRDFKNF